MAYTINFREVVYALSEALDMVGIDDMHHGKRVAFMAAECLKERQCTPDEVTFIILLGMLHDCGVSSTQAHSHLVNEFDWDSAEAHCILGHERLERLSTFRQFALPVRYHHTHWDELEPMELDTQVKLQANLIFLTDRVDALMHSYLFNGRDPAEVIQQIIQKNASTMFSPEAVELFLRASRKDSFWFYQKDDALEEYLSEWIAAGTTEEISFETLKEIAVMFSEIVDAKSNFTHEHSVAVSSLSLFLADLLGLSPAQREKIELASLLHDLGKLRVHDEILDKPGKLTEIERRAMNRHSFDSNIILRKIKGFEEIAKIAGMHHETLDGEGYPHRTGKEGIPVEARILAIADIFQALIQDRPYRSPMEPSEALAIMRSLVEKNKLDGELVSLLHDNIDEAYAIASGEKRL